MVSKLFLWAKLHKDWATALVMIFGLLTFGVIARMQGCTIHRVDEKFDEREAVKDAEIEKLKTEADAHAAQATALQTQVDALETEKQTLLTDIAQRDARIASLTRSKRNAETELAQNLRDVDRDIDPLTRCRNACDRAKQLGLLDQAANCNCK